jgi:hypothetical protein
MPPSVVLVRAVVRCTYSDGGAEVASIPVEVLSACRADPNPMPTTIDFSDAEHTAVTRAVRRTIDEDRFPHAPRLAPLRSALTRLDLASAPKPIGEPRPPLPTGPSVGNRRGKAGR